MNKMVTLKTLEAMPSGECACRDARLYFGQKYGEDGAITIPQLWWGWDRKHHANEDRFWFACHYLPPAIVAVFGFWCVGQAQAVLDLVPKTHPSYDTAVWRLQMASLAAEDAAKAIQVAPFPAQARYIYTSYKVLDAASAARFAIGYVAPGRAGLPAARNMQLAYLAQLLGLE